MADGVVDDGRPGPEAAALVAARVAPAPELVADPTIEGVDVVLEIGRDRERALEAHEAPAPRPPRTRRETTRRWTSSRRRPPPPCRSRWRVDA